MCLRFFGVEINIQNLGCGGIFDRGGLGQVKQKGEKEQNERIWGLNYGFRGTLWWFYGGEGV